MTVSTVDERVLATELLLAVEDPYDRVDAQARLRAMQLSVVLGLLAFLIAVYDLSMLSGVHDGWR